MSGKTPPQTSREDVADSWHQPKAAVLNLSSPLQGCLQGEI